MSDTPKLTVFMPVRDGMPYLPGAVESILEQSYGDFEFIVVDDFSSDATAEYLAGLNDPRLRIFPPEGDKGIVSAQNRALRSARGEWVARMDADDVAHPLRLEKQMRFLEANPDYVLVGAEIRTIAEAGAEAEAQSLLQWYNEAHSDEEIDARLFRGNCINHPTVVFRKSSALACGLYQDGCPGADDYDFILRLKSQGPFYKLDEPLLDYRVHKSQITYRLRHERRRSDARLKVRHLVEKHDLGMRPFVVFGAGLGGVLILEALREAGLRPDFVLDNDPVKWGTLVSGVEVAGGEGLLEKFSEYFVVLASSPAREGVTARLSSIGHRLGVDFRAVW